jgi:hypothetical protein
MPVRAEQELQTLNVENLGLKTNLYGNLMIPPLSGKVSGSPLQKAKSLDKVNLSEIKSIDSHHKSLNSIDNGNGHLKKIGLETPKVIDRYDSGYGSGYGSYVDFQSETTFSESKETLIEEPDHLNDVDYISGTDVSFALKIFF